MRRMISARPGPAFLVVSALLALVAVGAAAAKDPPPPPETPEAPNVKVMTTRAWLGVELQDVEEDMAKALDLKKGEGALVSHVVEDSPAEKAGLEDGDVVVRCGDEPIRSASDLTRAVRGADPGDRLELAVVREGKQKKIAVELGEREARKEYQIQRLAPDIDIDIPDMPDHMLFLDGKHKDIQALMPCLEGEAGAYLGIGMSGLTEQLGRYFGAPKDGGVLIEEVIDDSPAAKAGLQAGDVIVRVGGKAVDGPSGVRKAMRKKDPGDELELTVLRDHGERTFTVALGEPPADQRWVTAKGNLPKDLKHREMLVKKMPPLGDDEKERQIIIRKFKDGADPVELDKLRAELRAMRKELEHLRQEFESKR